MEVGSLSYLKKWAGKKEMKKQAPFSRIGLRTALLPTHRDSQLQKV